jgi:ankyrin repeat protein
MKERKEVAKFKKDRNIAINKEGETYLHEAARMGNLTLLKKLVDEVNLQDGLKNRNFAVF